ncbi:MAG: DUF3035 domain-containing protein [Paracoccaceae bacterium]
MVALGKSTRLWLGLAIAFGLAGCETIGNPIDAINGDRKAPDEFQVLARKPLKMPGTLDLPEPRLGEVSPLEPDPTTDAVIALLGVPSAFPAASASPGEAALLSAANASASNRETALRLEQSERDLEASQPYETPSIFDLFGEGEDVPEDALIPDAEARRLQTEGVAVTPVDPNAVPDVVPGEGSTSGSDLFYDPSGRRPNNRLPNANTTTAF